MNKVMSSMPEPLKFFINCLYGAFMGILIMSAAVIISAFILTRIEKPDNFYLVCIIAARVISGIFAGRTVIRKNRRYAIISGAVTSLFIMGLLWAISYFIPQCEASSSWWQTLLIPLCTIAGAVISNAE